MQAGGTQRSMLDYFYTQPQNIKSDHLVIDSDEFNHLVHVMRKKVGDQIIVVNGQGIAYETKISNVIKKTAICSISKIIQNHNEPELNVVLAVGILKNPAKFDFLIEKVTELGVKGIIPLSTERTIPQKAKIDRWQKLALAAMKQCGRSFLPHIHQLSTFNDVLNFHKDFDSKFILHINPELPLERNFNEAVKSQKLKSVFLLIGPEGGFSDQEIERSKANGFIPVSLGIRRLRTETAAIAACSVLLTRTE